MARSGQLGDGTAMRRLAPVDVIGLSSGVKAIAGSVDSSCALTAVGGVKCWGSNRFGGLGDGTTTNRSAPVDVVGLSSGVTAITVGCALTSAGGVKCWGGSYGLTPVDVFAPGSGVVAITHTCALMSAGGVKCWGRNDRGQVGDGTTVDRAAPVDVVGLTSGVTAVSAWGGHSCALLSAGAVKCWGENDFGQVGDGTIVDRPAPVAVTGLSSGATAISAGVFHTCALMRSGGVKCWGVSGVGQLGDGSKITTTTDLPHSSTPLAVVGFGPQATTTIVSRSAAVTPARVATLSVRCGAAARCRGTLTLTARGPGKLGTKSFSIPAGGTRAVVVALSQRGFEAVVRARRLSVQGRARYEQVAGVHVTATRTIVLTAPSTTRKRP
jgi:alpha-tubulin suppressor-like RCC1 family protein